MTQGTYLSKRQKTRTLTSFHTTHKISFQHGCSTRIWELLGLDELGNFGISILNSYTKMLIYFNSFYFFFLSQFNALLKIAYIWTDFQVETNIGGCIFCSLLCHFSFLYHFLKCPTFRKLKKYLITSNEIFLPPCIFTYIILYIKPFKLNVNESSRDKYNIYTHEYKNLKSKRQFKLLNIIHALRALIFLCITVYKDRINRY